MNLIPLYVKPPTRGQVQKYIKTYEWKRVKQKNFHEGTWYKSSWTEDALCINWKRLDATVCTLINEVSCLHNCQTIEAYVFLTGKRLADE
jgi:hypothetical protein